MSKKQSTALKYTAQQTLPTLKRTKSAWDLKTHFYSSENDARIERDIRTAERVYASFEKKYKGKKFTATPSKLKGALKDYEALMEMQAAKKPLMYFGFRLTIDANDSVAQKRLNLIEGRMTKAGNKILFFEIELSKLSRQQQKKLLVARELSAYRYFLSQIFLEAKHILSEPEEKILSLKSEVSNGMWVQGTENILNKRTVTFKKESIPLSSAMDRIDTLPKHEKQKLWKLITDEFKAIAEVAQNELNAVVTNKKINDELRGYQQAYSATIQAYENDEKSVLALVDAISNKGFALSKKYYRLKARYAKVGRIPYSNRNDVYGSEPILPYDTAVTVCRDTFYSLDETYGKIFDRMLKGGQIDVYPKRGKSGGAFCAGEINMPTFVMLNQVDNFRSLSTLAHEMGHAIHTEMSKTQPAFYERYSTTTAETASTFFEGLVQQNLIDALPEEQKLAVLTRKINEAVATICRQIAFFNFELELHNTIRKEGALEWKEMAGMLTRHLNSYLGSAISVTEDDGLSFVYVSHFRRFFYVYSYAYGELMSNIMLRRVTDNAAYKENVHTFLSSGGNDTVENIFKKIGINARKIDTFLESLQLLETDIKEFDRLTKGRSASQ